MLKQARHPNVIFFETAWVEGHELYVVYEANFEISLFDFLKMRTGFVGVCGWLYGV